MPKGPRLKIYDADNNYRGSLKFIDDALLLTKKYGSGATIRDGHKRVVYVQGSDVFPDDKLIHTSYVVQLVEQRLNDPSYTPYYVHKKGVPWLTIT